VDGWAINGLVELDSRCKRASQRGALSRSATKNEAMHDTLKQIGHLLHLKMSRLAAVKNLIAGPLANAKAVRKLIPLFQSIVANSSLQYAKNIFETEPAIAWSFTIGLAGTFFACL
jgi:hypothetical protein